MNVLLRNKRLIYHSKMYMKNDVENFREPVPIRLNFEPTNSSEQVFVFGEVYPLYMKAIVTNKIGQRFKKRR